MSWFDDIRAEAEQQRDKIRQEIAPQLEQLRRIEGVLAALSGQPAAPPPSALMEPTEAVEEVPRPPVPEPTEPEPEPPPPAAETEPTPAQVVEALEELGPAPAARIREFLGVSKLGAALFKAEERNLIHRTAGRARKQPGKGQEMFKAGPGRRPTPTAETAEETVALPSAPPAPPRSLPEGALQQMPALVGRDMATVKSPQVTAAEWQLKVYELVRREGRVLANVATDKLGDRNDQALKGKVGRALRELAEAGLLEETGAAHAPWQIEQRKRTGGRAAGRTSIEYGVRKDLAEPGLVEAPVMEPEEAGVATLEGVRDVLPKDGSLFSHYQIADANDWDPEDVLALLREWERRGGVADRSPTPDLNLFQYVKSTGPGRAAELERERRDTGPVATAAPPVAGTGRQSKPTHPEVAKLVADARDQGCEAERAEGSGHWRITKEGCRPVLISSTPSRSSTVQNDRTRLKRHGLIS